MRKVSKMTLNEIKDLNNEALNLDEVLQLLCNEHIVCIEILGYGMNNRRWYDVRLEDGESIYVYVE